MKSLPVTMNYGPSLKRHALWALAGIGVGAILGQCLGCQLRPAERIVALEEPASGLVSEIVTHVLGSQDRIDALTLPDGTIVTLVKDPSPCLIQHELVHREQLARYTWPVMTVIYIEEVREVGYRNVSFEKEAYEVQRKCVEDMERQGLTP